MPRVYLLRCSDDTFYTGWTTDLEKRVEAHNRGTASRYTRARLPVTVVYVEEAESKSAALKREYALRKIGRQAKIALAEMWAETVARQQEAVNKE